MRWTTQSMLKHWLCDYTHFIGFGDVWSYGCPDLDGGGRGWGYNYSKGELLELDQDKKLIGTK